MKHIGIDIGTSSICGVVYDDVQGQMRAETRENSAAITDCVPAWAFRQDAKCILDTVRGLLDELITGDVASIGICGQMHGMLYIDAAGKPVSPLYTWQDGSAAQPYREGKSYAEWLSAATGYEIATGYGLATHFYNIQTGSVPQSAMQLCTVMDFVAMSLCGKERPVCEPSNAAALGFFDKRSMQFDREVLHKVGIDPALLPDVRPAGTVVGKYNGIPVFVPIGDNQAAFLGSVQDKTSQIHVTIGTSSQISVYTDDYLEVPSLDTRPLPGGGYILVGAALCGGCSLTLLKDFYKQVVEQITGMQPSDAEVYDKMSTGAATQTDALAVRTTFEGTRQDASLRGEISGISLRNFTPGRMTTALLKGICQELKDFYDRLPEAVRSGRTEVVGSGNALRKNPLLVKSLSETFGRPVVLTKNQEEAALGAAIACKGSAERS
ncbi:MAG: hypothetical protein J5801_03125 [Bacteroidales bacterium]|nr:hypothetical protein [Bacteroidales bacterium]